MSTLSRKRRIALWILQGLLAALFLFAGGFKLAMPLDELARTASMNGMFLKFIGLCEVAGGLGLVLPGLFRVRTGLTPLAAAGLVIIMIGATVTTLATQGAAPAIFPCVVGVLAAVVAVGRRQPASRPAATLARAA